MKTLTELMQEHVDFTLSTFPDATAVSSLLKLQMELVEAGFEIDRGDKDALAEEYTDCIMCIVDSAARAGVTPNDLLIAFREKLQKNKSRAWVKNADNTYSHVK